MADILKVISELTIEKLVREARLELAKLDLSSQYVYQFHHTRKFIGADIRIRTGVSSLPKMCPSHLDDVGIWRPRQDSNLRNAV